MRSWLIWTLPIVMAGACKKSDGNPHLKQVNDAFLSAGFKLDTFRPADPARFGARSCSAGTLDGVEAVVCELGAPTEGAVGKRAGEDWVAQAPTGVVLQNGFTLLALADRAHADPNGRTIHRITQAYQRVR